MPLDEAVLDHQVAGYTEAPDGSPRMQVVLVAARRSMIEALLDAAKQAGLKPEGVDLDAFALVRTLAAAAATSPRTALRVYCHLGGVSNLAIAVGSSCLFTRPLSAVWDDEDAGARLADEIRLSIDYYMTQAQAKPVGSDRPVRAGLRRGGARREHRRAARPPDHGRRAARRARPLGARRVRGPAPAHRGRRARDGEGGMKAVNLIPTDQRRAQASGAQAGSSYVVLGVLAVLLLMAVAYVFTSNNVNSRTSDAAAAKSEADQLEAQVAARGAYTNFSQLKEQRIASVRTVADTRFDWERLMRELSRVMPSGSWIQATDASVTGNVTGSDAVATTTTGQPWLPSRRRTSSAARPTSRTSRR